MIVNQVFQQLDLIRPERPVSFTRLEAESPRHAYYIVEVLQLPPGAGFVIRKRSGGGEGREGGNIETWWRSTLRASLEKKASLVEAKLRKKKGRIYIDIAKREVVEDAIVVPVTDKTEAASLAGSITTSVATAPAQTGTRCSSDTVASTPLR
jgi:hypothetical protein